MKKIMITIMMTTSRKRVLKLAVSTPMRGKASPRNSRVAFAMAKKTSARGDTSKFLSLRSVMSTQLQLVFFKLTLMSSP